jgi:hypothetical protein
MRTNSEYSDFILLGLLGIGQWLRNSLRSRGTAPTIALLVRMLISGFCGVSVSLLALLLAESCTNPWCSLPLMPGFLIGAMTPIVGGVHRDDNLLWYLTAGLNATIYGFIAFAMYPLLKGKENNVGCCRARYITGGASIPITPSAQISSRRTTAAVTSRNCFRAASSSLRTG